MIGPKQDFCFGCYENIKSRRIFVKSGSLILFAVCLKRWYGEDGTESAIKKFSELQDVAAYQQDLQEIASALYCSLYSLASVGIRNLPGIVEFCNSWLGPEE